jgi:hypothetical protein
MIGKCTFCTPTRIFLPLAILPRIPSPFHHSNSPLPPHYEVESEADRMAKGRKVLGDLSFLSSIRRSQWQMLYLFFATFLRTFKSLMNTYLQEKFKNLSNFQQLRALTGSLQTQQGHFHPWLFLSGIFQKHAAAVTAMELHVRTVCHSTNQTCRANLL